MTRNRALLLMALTLVPCLAFAGTGTGSGSFQTNRVGSYFTGGVIPSSARTGNLPATAEWFASVGALDSDGFPTSLRLETTSFFVDVDGVNGTELNNGSFCHSVLADKGNSFVATAVDSNDDTLCLNGTVVLSGLRILYDPDTGTPVIQAATGSVNFRCGGDTLTGRFSYRSRQSFTGFTQTSPFATRNTPNPPGACTVGGGGTTGGSGGTGGIPGSSGGGTGGGTGGSGDSSPIAVFPGFNGFGAGAFPGAGGSGGSGSGTSFLAVDIGFDMDEGIPSLENTDELDLPLIVSSTGLKDKVKLTASSDPEGLDLSFDNDTLGTENDFTTPVLIIKPHSDTQARDYLITVTATSGDTTSSTSFIVSLTCDTPFISSLSTSQPQSQTISAGSKAKLSVTAIGTGPFSYQWYRGTTGNTQFPVAGATTRELTTPNLDSSETYWVRVTNPCGTADSNPATVTVH